MPTLSHCYPIYAQRQLQFWVLHNELPLHIFNFTNGICLTLFYVWLPLLTSIIMVCWTPFCKCSSVPLDEYNIVCSLGLWGMMLLGTFLSMHLWGWVNCLSLSPKKGSHNPGWSSWYNIPRMTANCSMHTILSLTCWGLLQMWIALCTTTLSLHYARD